MGKFENWKGATAVVGEAISAMLKNFRSASPSFAEEQGLELCSMANIDTVEVLALCPSCGECWERFPDAALAVAEKLLADMHVLTEILVSSSDSETVRKAHTYSRNEMVVQIYSETLRLHGLAEGLQYRPPGELITQSKGMDVPISTLLFSEEFGTFSYNAYGYSSLPVMETFTQMEEQIKNVPHTLHLEYGRLPDELYITIDTKFLSPRCCISHIQEVCQTSSIPLKIDSKLAHYTL